MTPITFFVPGKPQTAGSKRAFVIRRGGQYTGRAIVTDDNPKSRDWKTDVGIMAKLSYAGQPLTGPIELDLTFYLDRPKGHYRTGKYAESLRPSAPTHPTTKPDLLKLARGVEDALTGIVWRDDSQIVWERLQKRYVDHGTSSGQGVEVTVCEMEEKE